MDVVLVGSQTGNDADYETLREMCDDGTIILDDANPLELSKYIIEKGPTCSSAGSRSGPSPTRWASAFCDHNHERKIPLAGYEGMLHFAREVHRSVTSPVWRFAPARAAAQKETATMLKPSTANFTATRNACKLCTPLGAALVFKGIRGAVPLLHGSQGCATYIRRYLISHYREPIDIACSNFSEQTAIFGGGANLKIALDNIRRQYDPELIGVATTCLSRNHRRRRAHVHPRVPRELHRPGFCRRWCTWPPPAIRAPTCRGSTRRCGPWWGSWPKAAPRPAAT
jgi:nitrogenase molybdenum-iron protein alpha/beta subunit